MTQQEAAEFVTRLRAAMSALEVKAQWHKQALSLLDPSSPPPPPLGPQEGPTCYLDAACIACRSSIAGAMLPAAFLPACRRCPCRRWQQLKALPWVEEQS